MPSSIQLLKSTSCPTPRPCLCRRYPRSVPTSVADLFINCLVKAAHCKSHNPSGRQLSTLAKHSSSAKRAPSPDQNSAGRTETEARSLYASAGVGSKNKCSSGVKDGLRIKNSLGKEPIAEIIPQPGDKLPYVPLSSNTSPPSFEFDLQAYLQAKRSDNEDSRNLFHFYLSALGQKEGTKSLQVVLSNPNKEILISSKRNTQFLKDITELPGVERIMSLLETESSPNQVIFNAYKSLPSPGVSYLSEKTRGLLLHRFAKPFPPRPVDALRYLALIDDMTKASLYISPSLWSSAIHLAGKSYSTTNKSDLASALGIWRRMEYEGGLDSTSITFNILFDIAIKAGQFKIADQIVEEMESRGVDFSRFGRVARIFLYGLKKNADGIRQAYEDFVEAGEIVDTVVLNCVMVSLIRAGEFDVAEKIYERMKDAHKTISKYRTGKEGPIPYPWPSDNYVAYRKASKKLGRILGMTAFLHDKLPDHHRALQAVLPLTPDAKTFHIFLSYHALRSGDLVRFMALLDDMEATFSIPPQGMMYMFLFQGFSLHGDKEKSMWTLSRLKAAWASFLRALYVSKAEIEDKPRTKRRRAKMVWENPLRQSQRDYATETSTDSTLETTSWALSPDKEKRTNLGELSGNVSSSGLTDPDWSDEADDDWKYENSVYLGRKMIISCLRAFSVCGGPDAVIEVWTQIDRLWRAESQKLADIVAVKTVLSRLLSSGAQRKDRQ